MSNNDVLPDKIILKNLEDETIQDLTNNFENPVDNSQGNFALVQPIKSNGSCCKYLFCENSFAQIPGYPLDRNNSFIYQKILSTSFVRERTKRIMSSSEKAPWVS